MHLYDKDHANPLRKGSCKSCLNYITTNQAKNHCVFFNQWKKILFNAQPKFMESNKICYH